MNWFLNLSTRGKLFLGVGTMLVFMSAVMLTAYQGIAAIQQSQQSLYRQDFADAVDLMKLRVEENGVRAALLDMMLMTKRSNQEKWQQDIRSSRSGYGNQGKVQQGSPAGKSKNKSVEAGREFVESYVRYMHYVEGVHAVITAEDVQHGRPAEHQD